MNRRNWLFSLDREISNEWTLKLWNIFTTNCSTSSLSRLPHNFGTSPAMKILFFASGGADSYAAWRDVCGAIWEAISVLFKAIYVMIYAFARQNCLFFVLCVCAWLSFPWLSCWMFYEFFDIIYDCGWRFYLCCYYEIVVSFGWIFDV